jgi:hypothetical protein
MSDFSIILDDLRDRMSEISAEYLGGVLSDEVYQLIAQHAVEITVLRMRLYKNSSAKFDQKPYSE